MICTYKGSCERCWKRDACRREREALNASNNGSLGGGFLAALEAAGVTAESFKVLAEDLGLTLAVDGELGAYAHTGRHAGEPSEGPIWDPRPSRILRGDATMLVVTSRGERLPARAARTVGGGLLIETVRRAAYFIAEPPDRWFQTGVAILSEAAVVRYNHHKPGRAAMIKLLASE